MFYYICSHAFSCHDLKEMVSARTWSLRRSTHHDRSLPRGTVSRWMSLMSLSQLDRWDFWGSWCEQLCVLDMPVDTGSFKISVWNFGIQRYPKTKCCEILFRSFDIVKWYNLSMWLVLIWKSSGNTSLVTLTEAPWTCECLWATACIWLEDKGPSVRSKRNWKPFTFPRHGGATWGSWGLAALNGWETCEITCKYRRRACIQCIEKGPGRRTRYDSVAGVAV